MTKGKVRQYTNGEITVVWKPDDCVHTTVCMQKLRKVFDPSQRPWINMDAAPTEEIINVVNLCTSKAISWKYNTELTEEEKAQVARYLKPKEPEHKSEETKIMVVSNGPAIVKGNFRVEDNKGKIIDTANQVALCRCAGSKNQPFCDGSHLVNGFRG